MPKQELGRLEEVPLGEMFADEPGDFTPWLYKEENLNLLGDAINLDLTPSEKEGAVGTLSVDIVAQSELGVVVIENQIKRSDHGHLGQLLSYAAGREARFLVWVAPAFKQEHLDALDWLNRWMPEDLEVYGVEVRLLKIDDSRPAPVFRAVVSPETLSRQAGSQEQMTSEESTLRERFFEQLVSEARERELNVFKKSRTTHRAKSFPCSAGGDDLRYWVDFADSREEGIMVKLYLSTANRDHSAEIMRVLESQAEEIETELGFEAEYKAPQGRQKTGWVYRQWSASIWDDDALQGHRRRILDTVGSFQRVLDPRVAKIIQDLEAEESDGVDGGLTDNDVN